MEQQKMWFGTPNGTVDGYYVNAGTGAPLVVIANGHNGFYNYGMFPCIQQSLAESGISSFGFNYTHSGIVGDSDIFEDLEKYGKNCRRLEKEDLVSVLEFVQLSAVSPHKKVFVLAHSMGGIATVFAAKEASEKNLQLDGLILLNSLSTLNVRSKEIMENWQQNAVWYIRNNRTLQDLPQGKEYLEETLASEGKWNAEPVVRSLKLPILTAHAEQDESVPVKHGEALYNWSKANNAINELFLVPEASHTLNTRHPFAGPTKQLETFLEKAVSFIKQVSEIDN